MKKHLLLFLFALFTAVLPSMADTWKAGITSSTESRTAAVWRTNLGISSTSTNVAGSVPTKWEENGKKWDFKCTWKSSAIYVQPGGGASGVSLGSKNATLNSVKLSTSDFSGKKITNVTIYAGYNGSNPGLTVTVGGTQYTTSTSKILGATSITGSANSYNGDSSGEIIIDFNLPEDGKQLVLYGMTVEYEDATQVNPPVIIASPSFALNGTTVSGTADAKVGDKLTIVSDYENILYTTDGNDPTIEINGNEEFYVSAFELNEAGTFTYKAIALDDELENASEVATIVVNVSKDSQGGSGDTGNNGGYFELVTNTKDLEDGARYIVAFNNSNKTYSMAEVGDSKNIPTIEVDMSDNKLTPAKTSLIFQLEKTGSKWYLKATNANYNGKYLTNESSVNTTLSDKNTSNTYQQYTIEFNNSNVRIYNSTNRYIMGYSTQDFRAYTSLSQSNSTIPQLYKEVKTDIITPSMPVVKIGDVELENEGSKVVARGTEIIITCENATHVEGEFNGEMFGPSEVPLTLKVTQDTELTVYGINGEEVSDDWFSYTFTVGEVDENMPEVGSNFKQVLNANKDAELTEGYYVIARHNGDQNIAMSVNATATNITSTQNVTAEDISTGSQNFTLLTTTDKDVLLVYLEQKEGKWAIRTVNYGDGLKTSQKYLSGSDENTNLTLVDTEALASIAFSNQNNANISFGGNNLIKVATNGNYFNHQTGGNTVQLYKYTTAKNFEPEYQDLKLHVGDEHIISTGKDKQPEISYRVTGNTTIISIDEGSDVIKANRAGSNIATVEATWAESADWFAGKATFTVTVLEPLVKPNFGFRYAEVRGKIGVGVVAQAAYYDGDGVVTYTIDGDGDVTINSETGMIRPEDLVSPKTDKPYTVTATVEETDVYEGATASYVIYFDAPDAAPSPEGDATFYFTNGYGMYEFNSLNTGGSTKYEHNSNTIEGNESHVPVYTFKEGAIEITMGDEKEEVAGTWRWFNKTELRVYGATTIAVSSATGTITSVVFNLNDATAKNITAPNGNEERKDSNKTYTWTSSTTEGDTEIVFTISSTTKVSSIYVTSIQNPVSDRDAGLAFNDEDRVVNMFAGEVTPLPTLSHNEALPFDKIVFSLDLDKIDGDHTSATPQITGDSYDNLAIEIDEPGVYTFRADYKGDDFLNGMAILRLNVFPRLSVQPETPDQPTGGQLVDDPRNDNPELTIVHPEVNEETGEQTVTIAAPSLDELNDAYRFSTMSVNRVEVKNGNRITIYSSEFEPTTVNALADEPVVEYKALSELPSTFNFTEDGYVKYSIVYAGTEAFSTESTVNVVMMPTVSCKEVKEGEKVKSLELSASQNSKLQYKTFTMDPIFDSAPADEAPFPATSGQSDINVMSVVPVGEEWITTDENATIERPDGLDSGLLYAVKYRSIKDISSVVRDDEDGWLTTDYGLVGLTSDGVTTGIEDVVVNGDEAQDSEAAYFNLQGVRVANPMPGNVYILVKGNKAEKVFVK